MEVMCKNPFNLCIQLLYVCMSVAKPKDDIAGHVGDFDEYTIYDQGQLNEYGLLKAEREKRLEGGAGLDAAADFDEYTIYDQGG